jgi:hypothetical protein
MTMLEQVVSKKAMVRLDAFRKIHGLRSRKQALEKIISEIEIPEDLASEVINTRSKVQNYLHQIPKGGAASPYEQSLIDVVEHRGKRL